MTNKAYVRAKDLYAHGAISQEMLEQAEDAEKDNQADLTAAEEQLKTLGIDKNDPKASWSGLRAHLGRHRCAERHHRGRPGRHLLRQCHRLHHRRSLRRSGSSAMCTRTTFPSCNWARGEDQADRLSRPSADRPHQRHRPDPRSQHPHRQGAHRGRQPRHSSSWACLSPRPSRASSKGSYAFVPAAAVLHLHDRDWVFVPAGGNQFKRVEVHAGEMLPGNRQQSSSPASTSRSAGRLQRSPTGSHAGGAMIKGLSTLRLRTAS
jgi:cobalt-zinc-cadmium efflux system membrane fusion protein